MTPPGLTEAEVAEGVLLSYVSAAANAGTPLTPAQTDRLRTAVAGAAAAGVADRLVNIDDAGNSTPALLIEPSTRRSVRPSTSSFVPGVGLTGPSTSRTTNYSIDTAIAEMERLTASARTSGIAGADTAAARSALADAGLIPASSSPSGDVVDTEKLTEGFDVADTVKRTLMDGIYAAAATMDEADVSTEAGEMEWLGANEMMGETMERLSFWKDLTEAGRIKLGDGTVITTDMLEDPDPIVASQALAQFVQQIGGGVEEYNNWANSLSLPELSVGAGGAAAAASARAQQSFSNELASLGAKLDIEDVSTRRVAAQVDRQLAGLAESRSRSDLTLDAILKTLPMSAPAGQTSFTANELGGGTAQLARLGGIDPSAPLVNYTGQQEIDPRALLGEFDQDFGVTGPLTEIPDLPPLQAPGLPALGAGVAPGAPPILSSPLMRQIGQNRLGNRLGGGGLDEE